MLYVIFAEKKIPGNRFMCGKYFKNIFSDMKNKVSSGIFVLLLFFLFSGYKCDAAVPLPEKEAKTSADLRAKELSQAEKDGRHIDFVRLLLLIVWLLSGLKVMKYLNSKGRRSQEIVMKYHEYLNLASLLAGPLVFLFVEFHCRFYGKVQKIFEKKLLLPDILDSQGKAVFQDNNSDDSEAIFYLRKLLAEALTLHASDIFIDPKGNAAQIRFRVDGGLRLIEETDSDFSAKIINVIKVAAGMDITERRRPQDGAFSLTGPLGDISLRVATVGAFGGEKVAMRILGDESGPKTLAAAGLSGKELAMLEQGARLPSGMVLICGPTGSGKTTTLYAMLNSIDYSIKNVISIEDPIEHVMPAISQMEVNESAGITFPQLLRNALRQNPDIICLGEIRDEETAQVAIHAAQTGHLIIATLHSNDNIGTIDRLANLHIPLRSIAGTLRLVVSQRLVRKLCSCKKHRPPTPDEEKEMARFGISCSKVFIPSGCPQCGNTGYAGRMAIFDILAVNDELRTLLEDEHTNLSNIRKTLEGANEGSLMLKCGCSLVAKGETSFEEIQRVTLELKE